MQIKKISGTVGMGGWMGSKAYLDMIMAKTRNAVVGKWPPGHVLVYAGN
jgi:hypothetical protein